MEDTEKVFVISFCLLHFIAAESHSLICDSQQIFQLAILLQCGTVKSYYFDHLIPRFYFECSLFALNQRRRCCMTATETQPAWKSSSSNFGLF